MSDKTRNFSVVMPIHNESDLLKFSLPSILKLEPSEIILLFDRCTDNSYNVAVQIMKRQNYFQKTVFRKVNEKEGKNYLYRPTFLRRLGYLMAKYDTILKTDADLILDPKIKDYIPEIGKDNFGIINFEYIDYPISFRNMLKRLLEQIKIPLPQGERWLGGSFIFSYKDWKKAFYERQRNKTKNVDLSKVERGEDTLFHKLLLTGNTKKSKIVLTKTIHLRPVESSARHYLRGQISWNVAKRSFLLILIQAIIFYRLNMLKGYLDARIGLNRFQSIPNKTKS